MTIFKLILVLISCALSSAFFYYYQISTVLMNNGLGQKEGSGRIEAFIENSKIVTGFWPRVFEGWAFGFGIAFVACFMFIILSTALTPNKTSKKDALTRTSS